MQSINLSRIAEQSLQKTQSEYGSTEDFLANAKVRLANVNHLRNFFPDLQPLASPIYERARLSTQEQGRSIATTLFAHPNTFCLQEKFYAHLSELQTSLKF